MKTEIIYTSIACNCTPASADWGANGLIAFGACNAVAIMHPMFNGNSAKILNTYVKHTKHVNTVLWLKNCNKSVENYLLSGADDGLVIFWQLTDLNEPVHYILSGHESGVNAVCGQQRSTGVWLIASSAADNSMKLWTFKNESVTCIQTVHLNDGFCLSLHLIKLPKSENILLAFSSDDKTISLWTQHNQATEDATFVPAHKLTGHEDWVRSLDSVINGNDILLASSSQDQFIRLWRISPHTKTKLPMSTIDDQTSVDISMEEEVFEVDKNEWFAVSLESVLCGHEAWVYSVNWHQGKGEALRLLSASFDKTLIIWEPNEEGLWTEKLRVGEVGGKSLGFFGGKFGNDGKSIMGHSYQGSFHIWNQSNDNKLLWLPSVVVSGHFKEVRDLAWEKNGNYLMTVSADQTTRLHAPWKQANGTTWHELARPQVHGFDIQALALLSSCEFASGAEEKIVRIFRAPKNFINNFQHICGINPIKDESMLESLPEGASVPSLGLSNKAVFENEQPIDNTEKHIKDIYPENYFVSTQFETPPYEETLMQNTLWPEIQKLYGHGFEIFAMAATPNGDLLATSCRATKAVDAQIIIWEVNAWKIKQKIGIHQLTITQMCFSPDGQYLLSVSRDRRWSLYQRNIDDNFKLAASTEKANGVHTRIIWACDWSHDGKYFATSSRDGKVVFWTQSSHMPDIPTSLNNWQVAHLLELKNESITAVAFAPYLVNNNLMAALGLESGCIKLYKFDEQWNLLTEYTITQSQSHHRCVKRLQFRPLADSSSLQLASCGDDRLVRIYEVTS